MVSGVPDAGRAGRRRRHRRPGHRGRRTCRLAMPRWFPWWSTPSRRFRCWPPAASPTGAASRRRWRSAPTASCWGPASSPARIDPARQFQAGDPRQRRPRYAAVRNSRYRGGTGLARRDVALAAHRFIERWAGREWALRQQRADALAGVQAARKSGDTDEAPLSMGQDAGLIHDILPAGEIVRRIARESRSGGSGCRWSAVGRAIRSCRARTFFNGLLQWASAECRARRDPRTVPPSRPSPRGRSAPACARRARAAAPA